MVCIVIQAAATVISCGRIKAGGFAGVVSVAESTIPTPSDNRKLTLGF